MNVRRCLRSVPLLGVLALASAGCPTRIETDAGVDTDAHFPTTGDDPRVPNLGQGHGGPSCSAEEVIDVNGTNGKAFRLGDAYRLKVDTRNRRNELTPNCVDRDSTEVVLRYLVPPLDAQGNGVRAIRVSSDSEATEYDTVLAVLNDCGPEYRDYSCNNDGFEDDGTETRRSVVYFNNLEPEQYVYILVDGYQGGQGVAEITVTEITELGVQGKPCLPVPESMANDPTAATAGYRCPHDGLQCQPGATADGTDLCLPLLPLGAACDPEERRNVCEPTIQRQVICAQNPLSRTEAVCALPGTAPGAFCRASEPRCDGRLACSPGAGFNGRDICVPLRSAGATCDPSPAQFSDRCDTGLTCCGDMANTNASFYCRTTGSMPCFPLTPAQP